MLCLYIWPTHLDVHPGDGKKWRYRRHTMWCIRRCRMEVREKVKEERLYEWSTHLDIHPRDGKNGGRAKRGGSYGTPWLHFRVITCRTWCDVMWCDVMWCDVMWCDVVGCDVVWHDEMWRDMMWCDMMRCDVIWCVLDGLIECVRESSSNNW